VYVNVRLDSYLYLCLIFSQMIRKRTSSMIQRMETMRRDAKVLGEMVKDFYNTSQINPIIPANTFETFEDNLHSILGDILPKCDGLSGAGNEDYDQINSVARREVRLGILEMLFYEMEGTNEMMERAAPLFEPHTQTSSEACLQLGMIKARQGDPQAAISLLLRAHNLGHPRARAYLAKLGTHVDDAPCSASLDIYRLPGSEEDPLDIDVWPSAPKPESESPSNSEPQNASSSSPSLISNGQGAGCVTRAKKTALVRASSSASGSAVVTRSKSGAASSSAGPAPPQHSSDVDMEEEPVPESCRKKKRKGQ